MNYDRILYRVVCAYYEDGLTQLEIGNKNGNSRIKVSRMLRKALKDKIVQIKINAPTEKYHSIETRIEAKYGLTEVIIAESRSNRTNEVITAIGNATAKYLNGRLQGNETISLTWGTSLRSIVNAINPSNFPNLQIVQMLGGIGEPDSEFHGADITRRMAEKFSTKPRLIHAPGIVKSKEFCKELINDIQVKNTLQLAAHADIAIVGIGLFGSSIFQKRKILSEEDKNLLISKNVVGDISLRFFNALGQFVPTEIDDRVVGLTVQQIKKMPKIIGVAGGKDKISVIKSALKGNLIDVLITDSFTAKKLIVDNI